MQRNTLSPVWDEAFAFDLSKTRSTELALELFDWSDRDWDVTGTRKGAGGLRCCGNKSDG